MVSADYLVVAAGAQANFFGTSGAAEHSLPLYSVNDAERLRARILDVLDATLERPELIDQGSLNFVIVGGGPTAQQRWLIVRTLRASNGEMTTTENSLSSRRIRTEQKHPELP